MKEVQGILNNIPLPNEAKRAPGGSGKADFERLLVKSLNEVNRLQMESDKAIQDLASGKQENVHETMIAMEKASVSFQMMMQIRNKIIEAYQEIMRSSM